MSRSRTEIIVFATAWGTAHGGINSLNMDLCIALARADLRVTCVVLDATTAEREAARSENVVLLPLGSTLNGFTNELASAGAAALQRSGIQPALWIGHDVLTGPAARYACDWLKSTAPVAIIHHMHYLSYKGIEGTGSEAEQKSEQQRDALAQASLIFAIGPKLAATAKDCLRHLDTPPPVYEVIPGLVAASFLDAPRQFQVFFAGRLNGRTARLKQPALAAAAFGSAVASYSAQLGPDPILTLLGADDEATNLKDLAAKNAGRLVAVHALPFITDRRRLLDKLRGNTAAMLLSVHEGFGLTGWEAIGTGVPLILSKNSGVHEFLARDFGGQALGCVRAIDVRSSSRPDQPDDSDVANVARAIGEIATNPAAARVDARNLRNQLKACTWESLAKEILIRSGIQSPGPVSAVASNKNEPAPPPATSAVVRSNDWQTILFEIYKPNCAPYYIERLVDDDVSTFSRAYHLWTWGQSGSGKTTALRRALLQSPGYVYISLSGCVGEPLVTSLQYLHAELCEHFGASVPTKPETSAAHLISKLSKLISIKRTIPATIHIDELPFEDDEVHTQFSKAIAGILIGQSERPEEASRIFLSSLSEPIFGPAQRKVHERLRLVRMPPWDTADLNRLLTLASKLISPLTAGNQEKLIGSSRGSPRFIKMCVRKMIAFEGNPGWSFERILLETASEAFA